MILRSILSLKMIKISSIVTISFIPFRGYWYNFIDTQYKSLTIKGCVRVSVRKSHWIGLDWI